MLYDTHTERRATLEDGTILVYRRPGGNMMRRVREQSRLFALDDGAAFMAAVDGHAGREKVMAAAREDVGGAGAAEKQKAEAAEERRRRELPRAERRALEREEAFGLLHYPFLIVSAATAWFEPDGTTPLVDLSGDDDGPKLDALRDLPDDVLEDAGRVLFDAHHARAETHRGN